MVICEPFTGSMASLRQSLVDARSSQESITADLPPLTAVIAEQI